ncbi:UDP:flavonoid glycosyltransferase YjiC (YdhE family) [Spinactinospora alkalitolerans]|uniref:UDP:flavonoid glycosyltransferase YjiC (YdhE family) n=1 Tax=Spinactinospora alkalitolerans TaxID=687207 RepID=A0A852TQ33_9ACTN|nr:nucleotide disphospho-sugar-binding domain-containing protein [Spinactinospora alkalitolerans]NYE45387.1 UDP:flavonoid glycosyltransferase YjiC (YdhE family) [Spinactinospora alkalitolerans]
MRVLMASFPVVSHYFPMVPLAWALRAGGHEVRVASSPSLGDAVTGSGAVAVPVGDTLDTAAFWRGPTQRTPDRRSRAMAMFAAVAEEMLPDLLGFASDWRPDVVVYEPRAYAGPVAAAVLGVPAVGHLWGADRTEERWALERGALEPLLDRYGVGEIAPLGEMAVDPCPPALQAPGRGERIRVRYVPYNGPGSDLADGDRPGRPRLCVTWGTTYRWAEGPHPVQQVLDALAGEAVEVVLAVPPRMRAELAVPDGVEVAESRPLHLLLPSCDGIVHHGGAGTAMTAAVHGLPQLVVPWVTDGEYLAGRVVAAGVGTAVDRGALGDPAEVLRAATRLLDDADLVAGALRLGEQIARQPPPAAAVAELERLVGAGGA